MLRVAICDNEKIFAEKLKCLIALYLESKAVPYQIDLFLSGEEFVSLDLDMAKYEIVFLDINMEQMNGIETAMRLRKVSKKTFLVFVTAFIDYTLEGYKVDAVRYVLKNVTDFEEAIYESLDAVWKRLEHSLYIKKFPFRDGVRRISFGDIVYIESHLHELSFHVLEQELNTYSLRDTMSRLELKLPTEDFVRIHQSFLVNLRFVRMIKPRRVILTDGTELTIAKSRYKNVKERFIYYQGEL